MKEIKAFLAGPTEKTKKVWDKASKLNYRRN